jgi:hypothetical protein
VFGLLVFSSHGFSDAVTLRPNTQKGKKNLGSIMFSNRRVHRPILSLRELLTHVDERGSLICFLLFKYILYNK